MREKITPEKSDKVHIARDTSRRIKTIVKLSTIILLGREASQCEPAPVRLILGAIMSTLAFPSGAVRRLPDLLGEVSAMLNRWYPGYTFALIGMSPDGDTRMDLRVPCPRAVAGTVVPPEPEPAGLDGLLMGMREVIPARFPAAEWAALTVHQPGVPDVIIPIPLPT